MPNEPTERELIDYVTSRFRDMGRHFAEPEVVAEAVSLQRDLWALLYRIDNDFATSARDELQPAEQLHGRLNVLGAVERDGQRDDRVDGVGSWTVKSPPASGLLGDGGMYVR